MGERPEKKRPRSVSARRDAYYLTAAVTGSKNKRITTLIIAVVGTALPFHCIVPLLQFILHFLDNCHDFYHRA